MTLSLYNTKSGAVEEFKPREPGKVKMYQCGPTVYNYAHIGNLRGYIFWDVLRRLLENEDYEVTQVMNITDFGHLTSDSDDGDDKMTKGLVREGLSLSLESMKALGEKYASEFINDFERLNILRPHHIPRASDYVAEDIGIIKLLEEKGLIYQTSDGLYFDTSKDPNYGKKLKGAGSFSEDHARVTTNTEKRNPKDFAVWKFNTALGWESPWGKGFPGWHIECSGMSSSHLGASFDIHLGGKDHIAIHHTNEIAQSENAFGVEMATFWVHNNFLNVDNQKISKSLENDIYLNTLEEKGFSPLSYRYFILGAHYRSEQNFTYEALEGAETAFEKISTHYDELRDKHEKGEADTEFLKSFIDSLNDDLNTAKALSILWEVVKSPLEDSVKLGTLTVMDRVLGLGLGTRRLEMIPEVIHNLVSEREEVRARKEWEKSDEIRKHIEELGFLVEDLPEGPRVRRVRGKIA